MSVFFTADQHYGHRGIIDLCYRPYATVDEMDEDMIAKHNNRVSPRDTIHMLGDVALRHAAKYLDRLNGKKHLYIGNHDDEKLLKDSRKYYVKVHEASMVKIDSQLIWCSHYAHVVWPGQAVGAWHLFGHSHGTLAPVNTRGKKMDVGVDCHGMAPISFDEVSAVMAARTHRSMFTRRKYPIK